jgi:hypothetical protein
VPATLDEPDAAPISAVRRGCRNFEKKRRQRERAEAATRRVQFIGAPRRLDPSRQLAAYIDAVEHFPSDVDLLAGWLDKREQWPELWHWMMRLARLCTSAKTERHFNLCGNAETMRRTSLSDDSVEALALCAGNPDLPSPAVEAAIRGSREGNEWYEFPEAIAVREFANVEDPGE